MAATRYEALGNAREPDAGTPGGLGLAEEIQSEVMRRFRDRFTGKYLGEKQCVARRFLNG